MRTRVALAHAWGCSPAALREITLAEAAAMVEHLAEVAADLPDLE